MSEQQFSIDFSGRLPVTAQIGMATADANANEKWKALWDACVLAAARKQAEITSDDVLTEIEALPNAPTTHNLSAIGPAMKRAQQAGIIRGTGRYLRSKREVKNGNLHQVWESKYFCADCIEAVKHAYSDATTPGFFHDKCSKHREEKNANQENQPAIRG
jgi:hypothetical protein